MNEDIKVQVAEPIQTVIQKLEGWLDSFISLIPNMAVTLLLLMIFLVLARLGSKLSKHPIIIREDGMASFQNVPTVLPSGF